MKSSHGYRAAVIAAFLMVSGAGIARSGDLPPDPGAAGATTLAGIDSDGDGLRDDVQRWIALNYRDSARWRSVLAQMARTYQHAVIRSN